MWQLVLQVLFVSKVLWTWSIHRKLCFLKLLIISDFNTIFEFSIMFVFMKINAWQRPVNWNLHQKSNIKKKGMWRECDVTAWLPLIFFLYAYDLFCSLHFKVKMKVNLDWSQEDKKAAIQRTDSDLVHDQLHRGIILQLFHKTLCLLQEELVKVKVPLVSNEGRS